MTRQLLRDRNVLTHLAPALLWVGLSLLGSVPGELHATEAEPEASPREEGTVQDGGTAQSGDPAQDEAALEAVYERLNIVGDSDAATRIPGSAHYIDRREIERQRQSDVHRILRNIPGISIQEEDGFGLRPNIGIRGTGVERSSKVTLLEDGVLIAPAPYAAPAAYYAPTAGRMEGFEVRKGSASIRQGPYTNGGAINYLSTSIPNDFSVSADLSFGSDELLKGHASAGSSQERWGWLLESFQMSHGGFKQLDGGGDTGFELHDYLGKVRFNTSAEAAVYQALELKLGKTEQFGHETYLGLTEEDFGRRPYRRYSASAEDHIRSDHEQIQLRYIAVLSPRLDLTATAYNNDFFRNWHKLEKVAGTGVSTVLRDPAGHARELALLRGEIDSVGGELEVRNNRRTYYGRGVETVLGFKLGVRAEHAFELGVRWHQDEEDRFQEEDQVAMSDGRTQVVALGTPGSNANRVARAEALSFFLEDTFKLGSWILKPGLRFETIDLERRDFGKADPARTGVDLERRSNQVDVLIPGVGILYEVSERSSCFLGVHRGFSPPGPSSTEAVKAEESINFEAGTRYRGKAWSTELVGFFNDYDNLLGSDTVSSGGSGNGDQFNGGEVELRGVEASLLFEAGVARRFELPVRLAYTFTQSEFQQSFETGFADWAPRVEAGDELPYIAEHQLAATASLLFGRWGVHADLSWVGEMRTTSGRGPIAPGEGIESRILVDLGVDFELAHVDLYAKIRNLTDERYVAARRPAGLRPGLPQSVLLGFSLGL